jgi:hypothetical protein
MNRKEFFKTSLLGAAAVAAAPSLLASCAPAKKDTGARLNISFQSGKALGETYAEKMDYCESLGVTGFEPGG